MKKKNPCVSPARRTPRTESRMACIVNWHRLISTARFDNKRRVRRALPPTAAVDTKGGPGERAERMRSMGPAFLRAFRMPVAVAGNLRSGFDARSYRSIRPSVACGPLRHPAFAGGVPRHIQVLVAGPGRSSVQEAHRHHQPVHLVARAGFFCGAGLDQPLQQVNWQEAVPTRWAGALRYHDNAPRRRNARPGGQTGGEKQTRLKLVLEKFTFFSEVPLRCQSQQDLFSQDEWIETPPSQHRLRKRNLTHPVARSALQPQTAARPAMGSRRQGT